MSLLLDKAGLEAEAVRWRVEGAKLRAVWLVESAGSGFLPSGRPKVLLERHILWRRLESRGIAPYALAAAHPELCGRTQDRRYYLGGEKEWGRVLAVIGWAQLQAPALFESYKRAVYEACSWGAFQLMGENYAKAGFQDVYGLVHALEEGEPRQLDVILTWMGKTGLLGALRLGQWLTFARGYNGSGASVAYAGKLLAAYGLARATGW